MKSEILHDTESSKKRALLKSILRNKINSKLKVEKKSEHPKNKSIIFIHCTPRTGSTILRLMLAGHSKLFSPPEMQLLKYETLNEWAADISFNKEYGGVVRAIKELMNFSSDEANTYMDNLLKKNTPIEDVYKIIQDKLGNRRLVDKSPAYTLNLETLNRAEQLFDNPVYIYLIRHPYSVIESIVRNRIYTYSMKEEENPFRFAERTWFTRNQNCINFFNSIDRNRYHIVKFEELVCIPQLTIRSICQFLGVTFEESMLQPYKGKRMIDGVGDPNIFNHDAVEKSLGDVWKNIKLPILLNEETQLLAKLLNYELPTENS